MMKSNTIRIPDEYDFLREVMHSINCSGHDVKIQSHHEAYALIKEHLDRYWQEILLRDSSIHKHTILLELAQIAGLCYRSAIDLELMQRNGL